MEQVAARTTLPFYNSEPPFHPSESYPELRFSEMSHRPNLPYSQLRRLLLDLGFDADRYGTPDWNPLGTVMKPGQTVLLKPNFVLSFNASGHSLFAMVTHPSILRALIDYSYIALHGTGRIIIADVPQMDCDWDELMAYERLDTLQQFYRDRFKFDLEVYDFRQFALRDNRQIAYSENRRTLPGDPLGNVVINLGRDSEFYGLPSANYYGADYDRSVTIAHHQGDRHEYCISKTILSADVFLSVPKMKVHKKVGVTLNLKGLVGINTDKNFLVHYRLGSPREGGDQLPDGQRPVDRAIVKAQRWLFDKALARQSTWGDRIYQAARKGYRTLVRPLLRRSVAGATFDSGNWYGNDSAWRMTADLAKILFFADAEGQLHATQQRTVFCVVDGIIGGENKGPLEPEVAPAGCLVAGRNPFAVDLVTTRLMGFNPRALRQFDILSSDRWNLGLKTTSEIRIQINGASWTGDAFFDASWLDPLYGFKPHPGWRGHLEVERAAATERVYEQGGQPWT
jgi:uncharacterized protein (DUF362 family)